MYTAVTLAVRPSARFHAAWYGRIRRDGPLGEGLDEIARFGRSRRGLPRIVLPAHQPRGDRRADPGRDRQARERGGSLPAPIAVSSTEPAASEAAAPPTAQSAVRRPK